MSKWLFAFIGYSFFKFPGAIVGYFLGTIIKNISSNKFKKSKFNSISSQEFELNLLALASLVIKADGRVTKQELDFVRTYFVSAYGKERANITFQIFNDNLKNIGISPLKISTLFNSGLNYESRIQVIHFLFGIAKADGNVSVSEIEKLLEFSNLLRLSYADFLSIKAMFVNEVGGAYKILEIEKSVSNQQVKRAYRDLAKKHHPDKVQHLGSAYVKAAQDKFQKIQKAYESIKQERGF
ncbi:MAG: TerB family tellurite resistance protein [Flavobacteriales bacterium]|jgi:DnaJ like chaperone protein|tara:strand:+ start:4806 stop:5522 length:717 start_codon:yes stop_codon:yes gene_type:complete